MFDEADSAAFSPNSKPGQVCATCHDCRPLYEEAVSPTHEALVLRPGSAQFFDAFIQRNPGFRFPAEVSSEFVVLDAKLRRVRRIAGLYARAFLEIETLGVAIPFPGVAAFAANVVHNELDFAINEYATTFLRQIEHENRVMNKLVLPLNRLMLSPTGLPAATLKGMIRDIIYGNLLVFVEVFPIYTFCIKHFRRFGVPRTEDKISAFETCLRNFIQWWDKKNFGAGDDAFQIDGVQRILIDRAGRFGDGIIAGLRGDKLESALAIMENEQIHTLQEYMYDRIDWAWSPLLSGPYDFDDPFHMGAYMRDIALTFAADLKRRDIPVQYILPWTGGNVTEIADRIPFTEAGVRRFIELYYGGQRDYMHREEIALRGYSNAS